MKNTAKYVSWGIALILTAALVMKVSTVGKRITYENNDINQEIDLEDERPFYRVPYHDYIKIDEESIVEMQKLPPLARMDRGDAKLFVEPLQVMKRISTLNLSEEQLYQSNRICSDFVKYDLNSVKEWEVALFEGNTTSELNGFLQMNRGKKVEVVASRLTADETVVVPAETWVMGHTTELTNAGTEMAFFVDQQHDVGISGFTANEGYAYGIYIVNTEGFLIENNNFENMSEKPLVIMGNCGRFKVCDNVFLKNEHGGAYLDGNISEGILEGNIISENYGTSNWMAGIVLTAVQINDPLNPYEGFDEDLHFPREEMLQNRLEAPHHIVISDNIVSGNNSSGIYCDGAYLTDISTNRISQNDKEGICLDYGSIAVYVNRNEIIGNGQRIRQTDRDLENDFVLAFGRLEDGSACAKLPGISIDNAAYNIIYDNRIERNYGSGVKMVRTGIRNIITTNIIRSNNVGVSESFHFFGIELGYAAADVPSDYMDFSPDYENIICRNIISGLHYAGVFLAEECYINDLFDNMVFDATDWSMESLSQRFNATANNFSLIPSRGISLNEN